MRGYTRRSSPIEILRETVVSLIRRDGPDLSARQLGIFLTVCLCEGPHTVRGLATSLALSKSVITRALDRLEAFELVHRTIDPDDRRSVFVQQTGRGAALVREIHQIMREARSAS
ncbi:MarR family transcriptional regulator [Roseomonas nepalensis]|uniref:MarR family transcriptional regulator n=1 Tax=Muricoccus nepalensis TaxID=1854500 RepID=A0A502EG29_9PROT|nr:MarR family transcriptional regulator [Roseomonas nepalensis]TPG36407.1 MarR family transcriptional regulator [Roseomonas nepalensis]